MSLLTSETRGNDFCIILCNKIDSNNAADVETEVMSFLENAGTDKIVLDAENLNYISSAGLRIVLRVRKAYPLLRVINVSPEVYEIFNMTGFTEMIKVEKAYKSISIEGCKVIGKGAKGTLYQLTPDTTVKVYHDPDSLPAILRERELARTAFVLGIPTAISYDVVKVGNTYGSVFELLNAKSFSMLIAENPELVSELTSEFASVLRDMHKTEVNPSSMPDIKILIEKWVDESAKVLPSDAIAKIRQMIADVPDTHTMIHGDYHTNNIMKQGNETILIDMDTLSHGHPVFELANIRITYVNFGEFDPSMTENFYGFSYLTARTIWEEFLKDYLQTSDEKIIASVDDKVNILSLLRLIRHNVRRGALDDAQGKKILSICSDKVVELLGRVDSLVF